jgi:long-chain acyl-CoA synthetase
MHYNQLRMEIERLTGPGGPFEIECADVRGTILKTYRHAPANLREVWRATEAFGDREYLVYKDERMSYAQAHATCACVAGWLAGQGVGPGDRVAIAMRNYPEWMLIYWSCMLIGATVVGMNAWWSSDEITHALINSAPSVVFADGERLERLGRAQGAPCLKATVLVRASSQTLSASAAWEDVIAYQGRYPEPPIDPDSTACLFYTSGTTGTPKAAQITHRGAVCNLFNVLLAGASQARASVAGRGLPIPADQPPPVALITTPLFHVTANNCGAQIATMLGGKVITMFRWDVGEALRIIEREGVTNLSGVPVMSRELISHPDFPSTNTSTLQSMGGGGAPLQPDLIERISAFAPGLSSSSGYGMTEASGLIASISGDFLRDKPTSCGPILPIYDVRFVGDDGEDLPPGLVGELWVRGASVIKGYLADPEATREALQDGWLRTGDIARMDDDGFLYIVDRKKDIILRGGENVSCGEVEAAIYRHASVVECCVFGIADDRLGEKVAAAVLPCSGHGLTEDALQEHCRKTLAAYKVPEKVWILDRPLPRNATGKFVKKKLREMIGAEARI